MKKILILVVFALIGGGLYASGENVVSGKGGQSVVNDTLKKGGQGNLDMQKLKQIMESGAMPKFRITQNITPVNVSSTNKNVKIDVYRLCDTSCVVLLNVAGCKGKLTGIDTSAYLQAGPYKYKIVGVQEATLPQDSKTPMKWDSKTNVLSLVFPHVKIVPNQWDWELVLSESKDGVRVKTRFEAKK